MNKRLQNALDLKERETARTLALRSNFSAFFKKAFETTNPGTKYIHNWHIDLIAQTLQACEEGRIKRLIINIPPRYLKSLIVNVAWPAWLLGHNPTRRIISASYSQSLATKHSIDSRLILKSHWYRKTFPETHITRDQNEKDKFVTTKRGFRLASSVGGTLTGEGGNFLIIDDPHNPANMASSSIMENTINWYKQVFASRLDDKNEGVIVLIMQRLHTDDLTGHLMENNGWHILSIPAITETELTFPSPLGKEDFIFPEGTLHPKRESFHTLKQIETEMGGHAFAAQYLQNPLPLNNGMIKPYWLRYYGAAPADLISITQSWDTAIKTGASNDYSVCTTWGETSNGYYLLDVFREKLEYPALKRKIINLAEQFQPHSILIEDKASGQSLIQDIKNETKLPLIKINPTTDKTQRMASVSALFEAGKVWFPEISSWLNIMEIELLTFPNSPNDDIVDSITQFLNWQRSRKTVMPNIRRIF